MRDKERIMLFGSYRFQRSPNHQSSSRIFAELHSRNYEELYASEKFCLYETKLAGLNGSAASKENIGDTFVWHLDIGRGCAGAHRPEDSSVILTNTRAHEGNTETWLTIIWCQSTEILTISNDSLGNVWLYFSKTGAGYLFSQNYFALAQQEHVSRNFDEGSMLAELALGYNPDNATLYKEVSIAPPGSVIEFEDDTMRAVTSRSS
jgi:hypothetical protein